MSSLICCNSALNPSIIAFLNTSKSCLEYPAECLSSETTTASGALGVALGGLTFFCAGGTAEVLRGFAGGLTLPLMDLESGATSAGGAAAGGATAGWAAVEADSVGCLEKGSILESDQGREITYEWSSFG